MCSSSHSSRTCPVVTPSLRTVLLCSSAYCCVGGAKSVLVLMRRTRDQGRDILSIWLNIPQWEQLENQDMILEYGRIRSVPQGSMLGISHDGDSEGGFVLRLVKTGKCVPRVCCFELRHSCDSRNIVDIHFNINQWDSMCLIYLWR